MNICFEKADLFFTLKNFRQEYCDLVCDVIISNGNSECDFVSKDNIIYFYDKECFCVVSFTGAFEGFTGVIVPTKYYSDLFNIKSKFITSDYYEVLRHPNLI